MLRRTFVIAVCALALCGAASAQEFVQTSHDKIPLYGTQGESALVVESGQTVEITGEREELDVLVRGAGAVLRMLPGSHLKVRTITGADGGKIEITEPATITIRNMPIDTSLDPSQYGHGLLVINGTIKTVAPSWRQAFCPLGAEVNAGDATLTLASVPKGWRAGDTLVIPDTRQPATGADLSAQTERATIAAIDGQTVTLTAPLAFNHHGWRRSDGSVGLLPDVANLTQPIVIRSENPTGVRGHVFVTAASHQDVEGVALVDMGRTTSAPLHSTGIDVQGNVTQIGTNQIGRYAWHHHHLLGNGNQSPSPQFRFEHCSVDGSPKWGVAVHGSHFGLVNDCAIYNCAGSGIVTEDPWVYGNKLTNNIVIAKQPGSGQRITDRAGRNTPGGDHWHDRGGLGLESAMNEITGNRLYCCKESIGMAGFRTSATYYPSAPGVCPQCDMNSRVHFRYEPYRYPFWFPTDGNVCWGGWRVIETWTADCYPTDVTAAYSEGPGNKNWASKPDPHPDAKMFPGLTAMHCKRGTDFEDQQETTTYGWRFLCDYSQSKAPTLGAADNTLAIEFKDGYEFGHQHFGLEVRGADCAYLSVQPANYVRFIDSTLDVPVVVYEPLGRLNRNAGVDVTFEGCTFGESTEFISGWYPKYDLTLWLGSGIGNPERRTLFPMRFYVKPWRDGRDYQVYHYQQLPTFALPAIAADKAYGDWPAGVNTHPQLIERGTPVFGDVVPAGAIQWGKFWASDITSCERKVELLEQRIKELEGN